MLKRRKLAQNDAQFKNLSYFAILLLITSFVKSEQINTHQTLTMRKPLYFKIDLKQNDNVKVTVFDTNADVKIFFNAKHRSFKSSLIQYCFIGKPVVFQFISRLNETAVIGIQVYNYQFSYELTINGAIIKRQENIVQDFINNAYRFTKPLESKKYRMKAYYESKTTPLVFMIMAMHNYTILANQMNEIGVEIQSQNDKVMIYFLHIVFDNLLKLQLMDRLIQMRIQVPNQMLKGCDGTNTYDSRMRACSPSQQVSMDYLTLHHIGWYPNFTIAEKEKTVIKITILELQIIKQVAFNQSLTLFYANNTDTNNFRGLTQTQLIEKYPLKQQCIIRSTTCKFMIELSPGNYTVMPVIFSMQDMSLVYLFQRLDSNSETIQQFYSTLPHTTGQDKTFSQLNFVMLVSSNELLAEITLQSESDLLLSGYRVLSKLKGDVQYQGEQIFELKERSVDNIFNKNLRKTCVYVEMVPYHIYLMSFTIFSKEKFANDQINPMTQVDKENTLQSLKQDTIKSKDLQRGKMDKIKKGSPTRSDYLETNVFQVSIANGKFPHKKIQPPWFASSNDENYDYGFGLSFFKQNGLRFLLKAAAILKILVIICLCLKLENDRKSAIDTKNSIEQKQVNEFSIEKTQATTEALIELPSIIVEHPSTNM